MADLKGTARSSKSQSSYVYCDWVATQDIANNKTNIAWDAGIVVAGGDLWYTNAVKVTGVWINGTKVWSGGTYSNLTSNGVYEKKAGTTSISHNADGTGKITVRVTGWFYSSTNVDSGNVSWDLPTIPRATTPTVSPTSVALGSAVTISMPRAASAFTHTVTYSFGSTSGTIGSSLGTSTTWTPPLSLASQIPSATSGTATITCKTYNGSSLIGTKTASLTLTVPSTVVPTINSVGVSEAVTAVTDAFGDRYIQNLSQLNVSVDSSGAYGSTIKSYQTSLDGVNYIQQAFTSNVIKTAGTLNATVKVTDSRGRTAQSSFEVSVVEYTKPTITSMVYERCDSDGTQNSSGTSTKVTIAGVVYPVDGQNTKALKLKYRSMADEVYTERVLTISDWTFSVDTIVNNTDPTVTYEYIAELTDKINTNTPETFKMTTGIVTLSRLAGGKGVTLFGEAEEEGFVVDGGKPAKFSGDVFISSNKVDDYIIERGTSGIWTYEKWASGKVELWGKNTVNTVASNWLASGNLFYYNLSTHVYPFTLNSVEFFDWNCEAPTGYMMFTLSNPASNDGVSTSRVGRKALGRIVKPTIDFSVNIYYHVIGTWK